jgi:hypothetical protein
MTTTGKGSRGAYMETPYNHRIPHNVTKPLFWLSMQVQNQGFLLPI